MLADSSTQYRFRRPLGQRNSFHSGFPTMNWERKQTVMLSCIKETRNMTLPSAAVGNQIYVRSLPLGHLSMNPLTLRLNSSSRLSLTASPPKRDNPTPTAAAPASKNVPTLERVTPPTATRGIWSNGPRTSRMYWGPKRRQGKTFTMSAPEDQAE
jgi:hypothetical protein